MYVGWLSRSERPFGLSGHIDMVAPHGRYRIRLQSEPVAVAVPWLDADARKGRLYYSVEKVQRPSESLGGVL